MLLMPVTVFEACRKCKVLRAFTCLVVCILISGLVHAQASQERF